jgi:hypothetical protein
LEAVHADDLDTLAPRLAAHYEHARETEEAAAYYARAAQVAERMQQREDAARYRSRASTLLEGTTTRES